MLNSPQNEQESQQDVLERVNRWINVLDERASELLSNIDLESMKPGECIQAANRCLTLMMRFLQLRQENAQTDQLTYELQALVDAVLNVGNEGERLITVED